MNFAIVVLYVVASYLRPQELYPALAQVRPMLWLYIITSLSVASGLLNGLGRAFRAPQYLLVACFVASISISRFSQDRYWGSLFSPIDIVLPVAIFYFISLTVTSIHRLQVLSWVLVATFICLTLQAIIGYETGSEVYIASQGSDREDGFQQNFSEDDIDHMGSEALSELKTLKRLRSIGFLNDPNDFAQALIAVLPLILRNWSQRNRLSSLIFVAAPAALIVFAVYLTHSRGALIGLAVLILLVIWDRWGPAMGLILAGASGFVAIAGNLTGGRSFAFTEASNYGRIDAWSEGFGMLRSRPLFGVGYGNFLENHVITAHNSFVLCFAELGLVGYFTWLSLLVVTNSQLLAVARSPEADLQTWARAIRYSLLSFLATSFFLSRTYTLTLYLIIGIGVCLHNIAAPTPRECAWPPAKVWARSTIILEIASLGLVYFVVRAGHKAAGG